MDANIVDLETLYSKSVSYRIPQFQRPYAWKKNEQWEPLWDDVRSMAEGRLASLNASTVRPHFMGAIVLQRQNNKTGEVEKRLVVDGQQRLTTLQLLIKASQEAFVSQNDSQRANRLSKLTRNDHNHLGGDDDNYTKIRQSNLNDQADFQRVIRNIDTNSEARTSSIKEAFEFFRSSVTDWLNQDVSILDAKADAIEEALTKRILIAAIDLDEEESPHIIFETLNERGEELTQSDRVKNTVMYEAKVVDDAQKATDLWGMFEYDLRWNPLFGQDQG